MRSGHAVTLIEHPLLPESQTCSRLLSPPAPAQAVTRRRGDWRRYLEDFRLTVRWSRDGAPNAAVGFDALCAAALARALKGRSRVVLYLVDWTCGNYMVNTANHLAAHLVDEIWCVTPAIAGRLGGRRVRVVPNLPLRFVDRPPAVPARLEDFRLGYIGHLTPEQDLTPILRALALLPPPARPALVVAGDGPCRSAYLQMSTALGLERVEFTGRLTTEEELARFFRSIHCGLSPYSSRRMCKLAQGDSIKIADYVANYRFVLMTCRMPGTDRVEEQGLGCHVPEDPQAIARVLTALPGINVDTAAADAFWEERIDVFKQACRL